MALRRTRVREEKSTRELLSSRVAARQGRGTPSRPADNSLIVSVPATTLVMTQALQTSQWKNQHQRPGDHLHVSDLISKCIRKRAIHHREDTKAPPRRLSLSDMLTFAMGDAVHDTLKERARVGKPEQVWGKWSCKCEHLFHEEPCTYAEIDQHEECPQCGSLVDRYHEVSIFDDEYGVVGNPDLIFYLSHLRAYYINELKSIAPKQFEELVRPQPDHVLQVVWYWHLMHRAGFRLADKVSIFYASKGWMFEGHRPHKEFVIDPQAELKRLDDMIADAKAYKASIESKKAPLPPRTFCADKSSKKAKGCEVCHLCFGGKNEKPAVKGETKEPTRRRLVIRR